MLAQDRTAQLSPRAVLIAVAAIAVVVLALAAGLAIRLATTSSVAAPQAPTTVNSQVSTSGATDSCVHVNHHKGC
jgi:anti-sigma-K factor RskA